MAKGQDSKRNVKKEPTKTAKEKKAAKRLKKNKGPSYGDSIWVWAYQYELKSWDQLDSSISKDCKTSWNGLMIVTLLNWNFLKRK